MTGIHAYLDQLGIGILVLRFGARDNDGLTVPHNVHASFQRRENGSGAMGDGLGVASQRGVGVNRQHGGRSNQVHACVNQTKRHGNAQTNAND